MNGQMSTHFILHTLNSLHTEVSTHMITTPSAYTCTRSHTQLVKGEDTQLADIPIAF